MLLFISYPQLTTTLSYCNVEAVQRPPTHSYVSVPWACVKIGFKKTESNPGLISDQMALPFGRLIFLNPGVLQKANKQ